MGWTEDRVEALSKLWPDGLSASQIAKQLGGVTRNAVIGKVHRLGLSGRAAPSQPERQPVKAVRAPRPVAPAAPPVYVRIEAAPAPVHALAVTRVRTEEIGSATVLTLGSHMCKWPIGDPGDSNFGFCGRRSSEEGPYCGEHANLAYQPTARRPSRRNDASELARSLRRYI